MHENVGFNTFGVIYDPYIFTLKKAKSKKIVREHLKHIATPSHPSQSAGKILCSPFSVDYFEKQSHKFKNQAFFLDVLLARPLYTITDTATLTLMCGELAN